MVFQLTGGAHVAINQHDDVANQQPFVTQRLGCPDYRTAGRNQVVHEQDVLTGQEAPDDLKPRRTQLRFDINQRRVGRQRIGRGQVETPHRYAGHQFKRLRLLMAAGLGQVGGVMHQGRRRPQRRGHRHQALGVNVDRGIHRGPAQRVATELDTAQFVDLPSQVKGA